MHRKLEKDTVGFLAKIDFRKNFPGLNKSDEQISFVSIRSSLIFICA